MKLQRREENKRNVDTGNIGLHLTAEKRIDEETYKLVRGTVEWNTKILGIFRMPY